MKIHLVDAFADAPFRGNPAGVMVHDAMPSEGWMQRVAGEMNQAETAFLAPLGQNRFHLRWFTPICEVDLCGHATLASAHVLYETLAVDPNAEIAFETKSGELRAAHSGQLIELDFPAEPVTEVASPNPDLGSGNWFANRMDWLLEVESESAVRAYRPDITAIHEIGKRGLILTAPSSSSDYDFVSRFFAPQSGVPEDAVTGSAHCALAPFWSERMSRSELVGFQASARGGLVATRLAGGRVMLGGRAVTTLTGELHVDIG